MMKRAFDLLAGIILIILSAPFLLILAMTVRLFMGSPIMFRQTRPGLGGRPFNLLKFRTMSNLVNDEGVLLPDEKRLTNFGRFMRKYSLDELPQLINVVKGDISFVGPRPLLMQYLERYTPKQARRHEVKPGITGWAQVNGRNAVSWEEKFELDIWYVDNQTFWLDIKILWLTLMKVLKAEGISGEGSATMREFMGSTD
jgi:sugar transferase EpsL